MKIIAYLTCSYRGGPLESLLTFGDSVALTGVDDLGWLEADGAGK